MEVPILLEEIRKRLSNANFYSLVTIIILIVMLMKVTDINDNLEQIKCRPIQENDGAYRVAYGCEMPEGYIINENNNN